MFLLQSSRKTPPRSTAWGTSDSWLHGQLDPQSEPSLAFLAAVQRYAESEMKRYTEFYFQAQMAAVDANIMRSQGRAGYVASTKWGGTWSEGALAVNSQSSVPAASSAVRGLGAVLTSVLP